MLFWLSVITRLSRGEIDNEKTDDATIIPFATFTGFTNQCS